MSELTQDRLKELLHYTPETGVFIRLKTVATNAKRGDVAGSTSHRGYRNIKVDGIEYKAHRLAWFYTYGVWPRFIDHVKGVRDDNRILKLRDASYTDNNRNAAMRKDNASGFTGVSWNKLQRQWLANIKINGKKKYLGCFTTHYAACYARHYANIKYGFHENHGKKRGSYE